MLSFKLSKHDYMSIPLFDFTYSYSVKEEVNGKPPLCPRESFEQFKDTVAMYALTLRSKMQLICKSDTFTRSIVVIYLACVCASLLLFIIYYVVIHFFLNKQIPGVLPTSAGETSTLGARLRPAL